MSRIRIHEIQARAEPIERPADIVAIFAISAVTLIGGLVPLIARLLS